MSAFRDASSDFDGEGFQVLPDLFRKQDATTEELVVAKCSYEKGIKKNLSLFPFCCSTYE